LIPVTIDSIEYAFPTCWDDVTLEQYKKLEAATYIDEAVLISIFTGLDYDEVVAKDLSEFEKVIALLSFTGDPMVSSEVLNSITIEGEVYELPKEIKKETWVQTRSLRKILMNGAKNKSKYSELIAPAITVYLQPVLDGKVDSRNYPSIEAKVNNLPITTVMPLADFFLNKSITFLPMNPST
jgi:hypothetical protein